jgi:probable phosphoglycerate mutase
METHIFLLRHGETEWNAARRLQGQSDSPLTEAGRAQLPAVARRVAALDPDVIISSDLGRAMETARGVSEGLDIGIEPNQVFRERSFGHLEGLSWEEVSRRYPEEYAEARTNRWHFTPPGGESWNDAAGRVVAGLEELVMRHAGKRLLIVSHGGVCQLVVRHVLGIPNELPRRFEIRNLSLHHIVNREGIFFVETLGDRSHLE